MRRMNRDQFVILTVNVIAESSAISPAMSARQLDLHVALQAKFDGRDESIESK